MRDSSRPLGRPDGHHKEQPNIQGVAVPADMPTTNLRPFSELLSEVGLGDDRLAEAHGPKEPEAPAVISKTLEPGPNDVFLSGEKLPGETAYIEMALIRRGRYQPRTHFNPETLSLLASTIEDSGGLNNAIVVRPLQDGTFELIAGERRFRAHELLRKARIYALIRKLSDEDAAVLSVTDNDARDDLSDYERGRSYRRLLDDKIVVDQSQLSRRVGKSMATISRCLAYFKLPEKVILLLEEDPVLIGNRVVADFVSLSEKGYKDEVVAAAVRIRDGASQDNALNWVKGEVKKREYPHVPVPPKQIRYKDRSQLDAKIDGRKLVLTPPKGVTPEEVLTYLEKMLQSLDE